MITLEQFKQELYNSFFNEEYINIATDKAVGLLNSKRKDVDLNVRLYQEQYEKQIKKGADEETLKELKQLANKDEYLKETDYLQDEIEKITEYMLQESKNQNSVNYKAYARHFVYGDEITLKQDRTLEDYKLYSYLLVNWLIYVVVNLKANIYKRFTVVINASIYHGGMLPLLKETLPNSKETMLDRLYSFAVETAKLEYDEEITETKEELAALIKYLVDVLKRCEDLGLKTAEENDRLDYIGEQIALPLDYGASEMLTVTDTPLTKELATVDSETIELANKIKNSVFAIDSKSVEKAEEKLQLQLDELERFILDTVAVDMYTKNDANGIPTLFTDKQLAKLYTMKNGQHQAYPLLVEDIRRALDRLSQLKISYNYNSIKELSHNNRLKLERTSRLIDFELVKVTDENKGDKTYNYKVTSEPFYLKYLKSVYGKDGVVISNYSRDLMTRKIKGTDKSTPNQNLKHMLIRRLAPLKELGIEIYIPIDEIYKIKGIGKEIGTTKREKDSIRKAKQLAKDTAEKILDDFNKNKDYSCIVTEKYKGSKLIGLQIKPKKKTA